MSGLSDNIQLGAAGSKRDLSWNSHSKLIPAFTYKMRTKVCKRNHLKKTGWVVGMKYWAQAAGEARREKSHSRSQEKVFTGWALTPSQDEERQGRRRVGSMAPGAQDRLAGGVRLAWRGGSLLQKWNSSLCKQCQVQHISAVISLVVVVYPVLQNQ